MRLARRALLASDAVELGQAAARELEGQEGASHVAQTGLAPAAASEGVALHVVEPRVVDGQRRGRPRRELGRSRRGRTRATRHDEQRAREDERRPAPRTLRPAEHAPMLGAPPREVTFPATLGPLLGPLSEADARAKPQQERRQDRERDAETGHGRGVGRVS